MAIAPLKLFQGVLPNPEAAIYVSPGGVVLRKLIVTNSTAGALNASISLGGFRIMGAKQIPANDWRELVLGVPLGSGDTLTGLASAGGLTVLGTGWSY